MNPFTSIRDLLWRATRHWLSAIGVLLATLASISFLTLFAVELSGMPLSNYTGLLSYVALPALFVLGLVLIPVGLWRLRKQERAGRPKGFPVFDFNDSRLRTIALITVAVTAVNLMLVSTATFKGLEVLHSDAFCGGTCHSVMQPEAVAHLAGAHANVMCADCHIGEGAGHFVNAKLRGATQLLQFIVDDVDRPIPQPTTEVATEICVRCHAASRFTEDKLHVRRSYSDDEVAVEKTTVYRARIGGLRDGVWQGVHGHNGLAIRYQSDAKRLVIGDVEVTRPDGGVDVFAAPVPDGAQWHTMGCTDCHNRPAHQYAAPKAVVQNAMGRGAIDKSLPFIQRESLAALATPYPSHEAALKGIPEALAAAYPQTSVSAAGRLLATEWTRNNFPQMKVTWGTYRTFLQHDPGCFRCHDKKHTTGDGKVIGQKCAGVCHDVIATEEEQPEVMDVLYPD